MARRDRARPAERGPRNGLVAAATRVTLATKISDAAQGRRNEAWQKDAWRYYDEIPEVKQPVMYLGRQLAKLRFFPAVMVDHQPVAVDDEASGIPEATAKLIMEVAGRLPVSGQGSGEFIARLNMNLEVPGECWLVGFRERTVTVELAGGVEREVTYPAMWQVLATEEIRKEGGSYRALTLEDPARPGSIGRTLQEDDDLVRVWNPHPAQYHKADSQMRALMVDCEALLSYAQQDIAESNSRRAAGLLLVPNEVISVQQQLTDDQQAPNQANQLEADTEAVLQLLAEALGSPIADPSSPATQVPSVMRASAEYIDKIKHLTFGRPTDASLKDKIAAKAERIGRGMNLPVEKVMGHASTTFANAAQIDEDEWEDYHQPRAELIASSLTKSYLTHELLAETSIDATLAQTVFYWFDPVALLGDQDPFERFEQLVTLWKGGIISAATLRERLGIDEDEAPEALELLITAGLTRGILTAELTKALLELLGVPIAVEALPAKDTSQSAAEGEARILQVVQEAMQELPRPKALGR